MKNVDLREFKDFNDGHLKKMHAQHPNIQFLKLSGPINEWPEIKHLKSIKIEILNDASCVNLATQCPQLQDIDIPLTQITNIGLEAIAEKCSDLQKLVTNSTDIDDQGVRLIINSCPHLKKLCVESTKITSKAIENLSQKCPNISELNFEGCNLDDHVFEELAQCSNLEDLILSQIPRITNEGLKKLENCKKLKKLHLCWTNIGDEGIQALTKCPIQDLNLRGTKVGDKGITAVASSFSAMEVLCLAQTRISKDAIKELAQLSKLKHLDLFRLPISDVELEAISENCHDLQFVDLSATIVGDKGVKALVENCPGLQVLDLDRTKVGNEGIIAISTNAHNLVELRIACFNLDAAKIAELANCPKLRNVMIPMHQGRLLTTRNDKIIIEEIFL